MITFPIKPIERMIQKNNQVLSEIRENTEIQDNRKYRNYTGKYFRTYVKENKIKYWNGFYCSICGKSIRFKFTASKIVLINNCICGSTNLPRSTISYDYFADWYSCRVYPPTKKYYDSFWFKQRK